MVISVFEYKAKSCELTVCKTHHPTRANKINKMTVIAIAMPMVLTRNIRKLFYTVESYGRNAII